MPYAKLEDQQRYNRERGKRPQTQKYQSEYRARKRAARDAAREAAGSALPPRTQASVWNNVNPDRAVFLRYMNHVKRNYGLSLTKYLATLHQQNYRCARCGTQKWGSVHNRPSVEHNHETKRFRGLVCHNCNVLLSRLGDTLINVRNEARSYIAYLEAAGG